jgi:hypothetical protein
VIAPAALAQNDPFHGETRSVLTKVVPITTHGSSFVELTFKDEPSVYQVLRTDGKPFIIRLYRTALTNVPPLLHVGNLQISAVSAGNTAELAFSGPNALTARITRSLHRLDIEVTPLVSPGSRAMSSMRATNSMMRHGKKHALTASYFYHDARRRFIQEQRARPHKQFGFDRVATKFSETRAPFKLADGTSTNSVVVQLIAIGTTVTTPVPKTRIYEYTYNQSSGSLLQFSVHIATSDEARRANLPVSQPGEAK